jgi:hypothetical protein
VLEVERGTADVVGDTEKFCSIIWRAIAEWLFEYLQRLRGHQFGSFDRALDESQPLAFDQNRDFSFCMRRSRSGKEVLGLNGPAEAHLRN